MNASLKKYIGNDSINLTYSTRTGKVTVHLGANCKIGLFQRILHWNNRERRRNAI